MTSGRVGRISALETIPEVSLQNPAGTWLTFGMAIEFGTSPAENGIAAAASALQVNGKQVLKA